MTQINIHIHIYYISDKIKNTPQNKQNRQNNKYKEYDRQKSKRIYRQHKKCLDKIKRDCGCAICGTNTKRLVFHHTEPKLKSFNITTAKHKSNDDLINEINKCIVLCFSCHNKLHNSIKPKTLYRPSTFFQT